MSRQDAHLPRRDVGIGRLDDALDSWHEQLQAAHHPAAQNDHFRLEEHQNVEYAGGEGLSRPLDHLPGQQVALPGGLSCQTGIYPLDLTACQGQQNRAWLTRI